MNVLETPVRSERKLNGGIYAMMSAFIPVFLILGGLLIGTMPMAFAVAMACVGVALFIGGALYANWKVALPVFAIGAVLLSVLHFIIFTWLPVWLPSVGINF